MWIGMFQSIGCLIKFDDCSWECKMPEKFLAEMLHNHQNEITFACWATISIWFDKNSMEHNNKFQY